MATVDLPTTPLAPDAATEPAHAPSIQPVQKPLKPADFNLGILFERTLDAIVVANVDDGTIALWNPAAEALFGYPVAEAVGQPIEILMAEGIGQVHHAGMERYRRTGHGLIMDSGGSVEVPARTRSGDDI